MVGIVIDYTEAKIKGNGRNLDLRFRVSTCDSGRDQAESPIFEISHFAQARFKFFYVVENKMRTNVAFKKHDSNETNDKVTVTCCAHDNTINFVCTNDWSQYMELCDKNYFYWPGNDLIYSIKANISVNITKPGPSTFFYEDDSFTDFHLVTEEGYVPVHKVVMAAHSDVFKTMLSGEWKETAKDRLEVKDVTLRTLQHLKDFMYLGCLPEDEELRPLLLIAKCYMMHHLEDACVEKLARTVEPEDLMDLVKFATDNHLSELVFSIIEITSHEVVSAAREAQEQKPKLKELEE